MCALGGAPGRPAQQADLALLDRIAIRSRGARRFATPVEPPSVCLRFFVSPCLAVSSVPSVTSSRVRRISETPFSGARQELHAHHRRLAISPTIPDGLSFAPRDLIVVEVKAVAALVPVTLAQALT